MAATAVLETLDPAAQTEPEKFDDDILYEEVDGQRIERRPMSYYAGKSPRNSLADLIIHLDQQVASARRSCRRSYFSTSPCPRVPAVIAVPMLHSSRLIAGRPIVPCLPRTTPGTLSRIWPWK